MFRKIMWATDGSKNADVALPYAKALAQRDGASLIIVHVVERYASNRVAGLAVHADEDQVEAKLKDLAAELSGQGLDASLTIVSHIGPQPAHEIAEIAREAGADLIVAGCHGHAAISGLLVGSVTQRLLHLSRCPVLVVPAVELPVSEPTERETADAARG